MTADQHTELIDFLARKFDAIDRRFDAVDHRFDAVERRLTAVEQRLTALEVSHEAMRDDIRALAEGQAVLNSRMDRLQAENRQCFDRIEVRFNRYELDFGTVNFEHGRRIEALERTEEP